MFGAQNRPMDTALFVSESSASKKKDELLAPCPASSSASDKNQGSTAATMKSTSHPAYLLSSLQKLKCEGNLCDVTIKCEDYQVKAHRIILATATDYFKAMFLNETKEAASGIVDFSNMLPEVVKQCIQFIYSGEVDISLEISKGLLDASEMLQLQELSKLCVEFLANNLSLKTCSEVISLSSVYGKKSLDFPIAKFLMKYFEEFSSTEDFTALDLDSLIYCLNLLQDGSSEHEILKWRGILAWVNYDVDSRCHNVVKLLSVIEWSCLPKDFILDKVCASPLIDENPECLRYLTNVAFGKRSLECKEQLTQLTDILAFNKDCGLLYRYNSKTRSWSKIGRYPSPFPVKFDTVYYKGLICVGTGNDMNVFSGDAWHSPSERSCNSSILSDRAPSARLFATTAAQTFDFSYSKSTMRARYDESVYNRCFGFCDNICMMTSDSLESYDISSS